MWFLLIYTQGQLIVWNWVFIKTKDEELTLYCHKNDWLLLWFLWKIVLMALDSAVYGNNLFGCLSVPPPASFKAIDLLQSNPTGRNNLIHNHIPQSVMKCTTPSEDGGKGRSQWSLRDAAACLGAELHHSHAIHQLWHQPDPSQNISTAARPEEGYNEAGSAVRGLENWVFLPALCWGQERATLETIAERDLEKARRNLKVLLWCLLRVGEEGIERG